MELAEARALVKEKTDKELTVRHLVSVEGVMRALPRRLGEDQDRTGEDSKRHSYLAADWLRDAGWRSRWSTRSWPRPRAVPHRPDGQGGGACRRGRRVA